MRHINHTYPQAYRSMHTPRMHTPGGACISIHGPRAWCFTEGLHATDIVTCMNVHYAANTHLLR